MSEKDNLQEADGTPKVETPQEKTAIPNEVLGTNDVETKVEVQAEVGSENGTEKEAEIEVEVEVEAENATKTEAQAEAEIEVEVEVEPETKTESPIVVKAEEEEEEDAALTEIDNSNAKEAEDDDDNETKEDTPAEKKNYAELSMEALYAELESVLKTDKIQRIKHDVDDIKRAFNTKFSALLEEKKKEFLDQGGNSIDFQFDFPLKKQFNALVKGYHEKRKEYYQNLQLSLQNNLENRLEIIEEIKGLLNVEENINTTYKHFKALQERWRNAGSIPRDKYNNVWNNYHHHVENFYDFLHLNRDLRDLDFKHNLDQKLKIIESAEELAKDDDSMRAFRELQALHKMWKEELGPVAKEHRDEIWDRFKAATKKIHDKRQVYFEKLDEVYQENLVKKNEIIAQIEQITESPTKNHSGWQKKIKAIEDLRQQFFNAGKVPIKVNEATWAKFKTAVQNFNRTKNAFYKDLKKEQYNNLQKKLELIKIAEENKDSTDFEATTPLMKKIQSDWKKIGHVPRKDSDKIWNQFKAACNHYFDKLHSKKNEANEEELEAYQKKTEMLETLKKVTFKSKDQDENLKTINSYIEEWRGLGRVPRNKGYIEGKFHKTIDALYGKLNLDSKETELLKYEHKLESFSSPENKHLLDNEHNFIRKRIDDIESEINQLENNLQFFSNVEEDNPLVKEVYTKIENQKNALDLWRTKLNKVKQYY